MQLGNLVSGLCQGNFKKKIGEIKKEYFIVVSWRLRFSLDCLLIGRHVAAYLANMFPSPILCIHCFLQKKKTLVFFWCKTPERASKQEDGNSTTLSTLKLHCAVRKHYSRIQKEDFPFFFLNPWTMNADASRIFWLVFTFFIWEPSRFLLNFNGSHKCRSSPRGEEGGGLLPLFPLPNCNQSCVVLYIFITGFIQMRCYYVTIPDI